MPGILLSGPAGAGKTQQALALLAASQGATLIDFQRIYAAVAGVERDSETGRYPERNPSQAYLLAVAEYLRRAAITAALDMELDPIVTNSDGSPTRRNFLLGLLGAGATEVVIDPGRDVVAARLAGDGPLSEQCGQAIDRWYGRL